MAQISIDHADKHIPSNSPRNREETGIFAEGDVEIKDTGRTAELTGEQSEQTKD